jgi:cytochrome d ubiquinol oxidase subunit II
MADVWYAILALTLIAYSVLDGFDFGVGVVHLFVAKTDSERRIVLSAIGPFWDGNEVWLIASGGVLFVAFPAVMAMAFPAFYLALFLVLWCLMLRGVSIEVRSHFADPLWRSFWDVVFSGSSMLLALLFGVALGNLVRGVPIGAEGELTMPFFTHFGTTGYVGLLDYYTVSVGALAVVLLAAHGATFLGWRTEGAQRDRANALAGRAYLVSLGLFVLVSAETGWVRPELFSSMLHRPPAWLAVAVALAGAALLYRGRKQKRDLVAFVGSSVLLGGVLTSAAIGLFPTLLHSTLNPAYDVAAHTHATSPGGLRTALVWWPIAFALTITYFSVVFRMNRDRVRLDD